MPFCSVYTLLGRFFKIKACINLSFIHSFIHSKVHKYQTASLLTLRFLRLSVLKMPVQLPQNFKSVQDWLAASKLKLNPDKTEFIIFGSPAQQASLPTVYLVENLGNLLHPSIGVLFWYL